MLTIKPGCECCDTDLPPEAEAYICTIECTWCPECVATFPERRCPNCDGVVERRPVRPAAMLAKYPASTLRVVSETCWKHRAE